MVLFGLGGLFYGKAAQLPTSCSISLTFAVAVLLINAIAILSEDRFLARSTNLPPITLQHSLTSPYISLIPTYPRIADTHSYIVSVTGPD
jgi:hypothetical protein